VRELSLPSTTLLRLIARHPLLAGHRAGEFEDRAQHAYRSCDSARGSCRRMRAETVIAGINSSDRQTPR
jgi:hypothetical protein